MRNERQENSKPGHITCGDVFEDLGLSPAELAEAKVKADIWRELVAHIKPLASTQKELALRLGMHQPEVSNLLRGKLSKFSPGALMHYAVKLGLRVEVRITAPDAKKGTVKALKPTVRPQRSNQPVAAA